MSLPSRMLLHWSERHRDYYQNQMGVTLEHLKIAARRAGFLWTIDWPKDRRQQWLWFELRRSPSQARLKQLRGGR